MGMTLRIGVIGGSIGGLAAAICLLRTGADVTIFERAARRDRTTGGGLGVDIDLMARVTRVGERPPPHIVLTSSRSVRAGGEVERPVMRAVSAYHLLRDHLRAQVPDDRYLAGCEVRSIEPGPTGPSALWLGDGRRHVVDAVISADGWRSLGRDLVGHGEPPRFAGYVLIRGLVAEHALPDAAHGELFDVPRMHTVHLPCHRFIAYPTPGAHGERTTGQRRLSFGWYFGISEERLRRELLPSLRDPARCTPIPPTPPAAEVAAALAEEAAAVWPEELAAAVRAAREEGVLLIHPVYEHLPARMAAGRVALVGDAAHLASPISAAGARMALQDALALEEAFGQEGADVTAALRRYEAARLDGVSAIVASARAQAAALSLPRVSQPVTTSAQDARTDR